MLQPELLSEQPKPGDVSFGVNSLHTPLRLGGILMFSALMGLIIFFFVYIISFFFRSEFQFASICCIAAIILVSKR